MERQTFILLKTKPFRHFLKLYMKNGEGKTDVRIVTFTTEHKISEKERTKGARKIAAEFSSSDENIIDALFRDTGYGKVFVHKNDPEGKKKKEAFKITPIDAEKIALSNLFELAGLDFDPKKSIEVLNKEYRIFVSAKAGVKIGAGTASEIHHTPIDIHQNMLDQVDSARKNYKEKYGEEIPEDFNNDLGFLSALGDENFDAKAYIESKKAPIEESPTDTAESMQKKYFEVFNANVAKPKKNDVAWMKQKIEEKLAKK